MDKIKLNLFDLKSKKDLLSVRKFFSKSILHWFNNDLSPKKKYFRKISCPLCGEKESNLAFNIENFSYHVCASCNSIYTNPHLKDGILESLYRDGTYQVYQNSLVKSGSKIRKGVLEKRKFNQISSLVNKKNPRILDVGCGRGTFLEICEKQNWISEGVETSGIVSNNKNIKIYNDDFNTMIFEKKYDVITFWGVLEHMFDPIFAIKKAKNLLNENGLISFEVPSSDSFLGEYLKKYSFLPTRYIESARHNIFFSKKIINQISKKFNLEIKKIESNGLDIQTILLEEFDKKTTDKILNIQDILNDLLLGDHYRVFLKKK